MWFYVQCAVVGSVTAVAFVLAVALVVEMVPDAWRAMMGRGEGDA